eukprot:TRINITY_DN8094_c0_g1_i1.p2 TRINITY_DN8094_c0_g1~~TRINITY_DN8094_c0_g1_i1.p2  ORF type:complete len:304 (+),score=108.75 TRINITY_DN8094_c0_g1_i1:132-1043(+)
MAAWYHVDMPLDAEELGEGGFSWLTWLLILAVALAATLFGYLWMHSRYEQQVAAELGEMVMGVLGEKEGNLYRRLHPTAEARCEKPFVLAMERAIREQLGAPEILHTSTLKFLDAPEGFTHVAVEVAFKKQTALVTICWESDGSKKAPGAIGAISVEPEDKPLDIFAHLNPSSFEQKSDVFFGHFFSQRFDKARALMHPNLQGKMTDTTLAEQRSNMARHMGVDTLYDPDAAYDSSEVLPMAGGSAMVLRCTLQGETQNAVASLHWILEGMTSSLLRFELTTTGKPNKETVFVNPDMTRYTPP